MSICDMKKFRVLIFDHYSKNYCWIVNPEDSYQMVLKMVF